MPSKKLRVLPLGGLGEIGKNMTVIEFDGRIVVVDTGLMFPTAEMHGIDLVLPDFSYLRDRADDIEAIVLTHGHEDHVGALPYVLREIGEPPVIYGGLLTIGMVRSKLDEHKLADAPLQELPAGEKVKRGPVRARAGPPRALDPGHARRPDHHRGRLDADDRRLQVRPDPGRRPPGGHPAPGRDRQRRAAAALRRLDQRRPARGGAVGVERRPGPAAALLAVRGADHRHLLRLQHPPRPAGDRRRRRSSTARSPWSAARCARTSTSPPTSGSPRRPQGIFIQPREIENFPDEKVVVISTGSQGEPLSALRRMANNDHRDVQLHSGDTVVFSATPVPGNERAVNETIDRIYEIGATVITAKDAPIHASGHGWQEEMKLMLNLTKPKYVMPVHGDHQRLRLHSELAEAVGVEPDEHLPRPQRPAAGDRRRTAPASARTSTPARCTSTASTSATPTTPPCATAARSPPTASSSSSSRSPPTTAASSPTPR